MLSIKRSIVNVSSIVPASVVILKREKRVSELKKRHFGCFVVFYLRVEESVCVLSVGRALVESVVAASRVVHVRVAQRHGEDSTQKEENP